MTTITTTEKQLYNGGLTTNVQHVVGYYSEKNQVVRYTFTTDANGANFVSWSLLKNYIGGGTAPNLRWYIGIDPSSHINAGISTTTYSGDVAITNSDGAGTYTFSGESDMVLLPNTTYYLWIFPNTTTYGWYNLTELVQATITISGASGIVYIDNGTRFDAYQFYIDNGTNWDLFVPYIDNGTNWDLYS